VEVEGGGGTTGRNYINALGLAMSFIVNDSQITIY
jgi:hypothetical protein